MRTRPFFQPPRRTHTLARGPRWAARLILVAPPLAFLAAAALYCLDLGRLLRANLVPVAAGEVGRQIGHETRIGQASYLTPGVLVLDDVAVARGPTFAASGGRTLATARRVTIHYDLRALVFDSGNAAHALGDVVVQQPDLYVERFTRTRFNFSDILKPKPQQPRRKPFVGQVIVRNGVLHYRDDLAPARVGDRPALNTLAGVDAVANFHSENYVYFVASGRGTAGRVATLGARGDAARQIPGRFRVTVTATDADAGYWTDYFHAFPQARVRGGRADVNLTLASMRRGARLDLQGQVAARRAVIAVTNRRLLALPVRGITGTATFTGGTALFDAAATVAGQALRAQGTVADFAHPQLAVTVQSPRADVARLATAVPVLRVASVVRVAPGPARVQFVGAASSPVITVQASSPAVAYAGNRATGVRAQAVYANRILSIPTATFTLDGAGRVALRGSVNTATKAPTVLLEGKGTGLNLARLRLPASPAVRGLNLGGVADVAFLASNQGHPWSVVANVAVARPQVRRTVASALRARVAWTQGQAVTIRRAVVEDSTGIASVSGTVPLARRGAPWDLAVNAAGVDLARWLRPYTTAPVGGLAYVRGRITGPRSAPQVAGAVRLYGARYGRYTADAITGGLSATPGGVRLDGVVIRRYPTEARVTGTVTQLASKDPALDLGVTLARGDVQDFVALAGQVAPASKAKTFAAVTGTAQGHFQIAGRLKEPRLTGQATITDATVGAYRVQDARADLAYRNSTLVLSNALVHAEGATLTGSGQWQSRTGSLAARFAGTDLDLARLNYLTHAYADVAGTVNFSGQVGGTLRAPAVDLGVVADDLSVDGQRFDPFDIFGHYADGVFTQEAGEPWRFTVHPTDVSAGEESTPAQPTPAVQYVISGLRLALPTPDHPDRPRALSLTAKIPAAHPEQVAHLVSTLRDSRFALTGAGQKALAALDRLPQPLAGTFAVPALTVSGPLSAPHVRATVNASGLALGESRIGTLSAEVAYQGGPKPAAAVAQARAQDLSLDQIPVDDVTLTDARYANDAVSVQNLVAHSENGYLHASGQAGLGAGGVVDAELDASGIPVSLFQTLLPKSRLLAGQIKGFQVSDLTVSASGPTAGATYTGTVSLNKIPAAAAPRTAAAVTAASPAAKEALSGDTAVDSISSGVVTLAPPAPGQAPVLTVSRLTAYKSGRPVATLSGALPVRWGSRAAPPLPGATPLRAFLQIQDLAAFAFLAPAIDPKRTGGALTATLDLTDRPDVAHLSGAVSIRDGRLALTNLDTSLQKINGQIVARDGRVAIAGLTGQSSRGGTVTVSTPQAATLGAGGRADVQLALKNFVVDETRGQNALARTYASGGRATLNGDVTATGPWDAPLIATPAGAPLRVTDASLQIPSPPAAGGGGAPPALSPRFDLHVALGAPGRLVSLHTWYLQAETSGNVALTGSLTQPQLRAHLNIYRGQLLALSNRLRFINTPGTLDLAYPRPSPDPRVTAPILEQRADLTAQGTFSLSPAVLAATASVVRGGTASVSQEAAPRPYETLGNDMNRPQRYVITVSLSGVLNDPNRFKLQLSSSPPGLTDAQIYAALGQQGAVSALLAGGTGAQQAIKDQLAQAFTNIALPTFLNPVETGIAGAFGLSDFSVDYAPDTPLLISLSKELAPRLEVTYQRFVGSRTPGAVNTATQPQQYTLKLGYRFTNRLQISVSTDDQRNNTLALEGVFNFY